MPVALFTIVTVCAVGRGGPSAEYYYSRSGNEMKADHTMSSFRSYDGEADPQRDNRRRSANTAKLYHFSLVDFIFRNSFFFSICAHQF